MFDKNNQNEDIVKVLVVDDSTLMRRMIIDVLNSHPQIKVVGFAINGRMAINYLERLKPDVVTLDVEMPFMNGLETLKEIKKINPIPTVMLSSLTKSGAEVTLQALELGAVDFIQKPESAEKGLESIEKDLVTKVLAAAKSKDAFAGKNAKHLKQAVEIPTLKTTQKVTRVKTVVIGCSTGGPPALKEVVPYIPADLPAQILIVQHMPPKFTAMLAQRLDKISQITVKEAEEGDELQVGRALMAPGDYHMCLGVNNKILLNQEPQVWGVRPAVDLTLASAAKIYKEDVIGVVLTGMGHDGMNGSGSVKKFGGYVMAEDKSTALIYGMPRSVIEAGHADEIVPLHKVANAIVEAVYR